MTQFNPPPLSNTLSLWLLVLILETTSLQSTPLEHWEWRFPPPQNSVLTAVAYGDGLFVAVGGAGAVVISDNGVDWVPVTVPAKADLLSVTYGAGLFVCVGNGGMILSSSDGVIWTKGDPITTNRLNAVAFGNESFVAVGEGGVILSSTDAIHWVSQNSGTNQGLFDVAYGNGVFTAVAPIVRLVLTSSNAVTWVATNTEVRLGRLSFANGLFISSAGNGIYTSLDGATWVVRRPRNQPLADNSPAAYGNGIFVLVEGSVPRTWISTNGEVWSEGAAFGAARALAFGKGVFVGVRGTTVWTTKDGLNWTRRTFSSDFSSIVYGGGAFVAVGGMNGRSTNGFQWLVGTQALSLQSVTFGKGLYVAVDHQQIFTSTNGLNWSLQTPAVLQSYSKIIFGNDTFMALGGAGAGIQTSPDGTNWSLALPPINYLFSAAYGNGRFVAVGSDGLVLVSTNASIWSTNNAGTGAWLHNVSFANGLFIAGSQSGTNYISTDGSSWSAHPIGPDSSPSGGVLFCDGTYLSAGGGGILSSSNAVDWVAHRSQYSAAISSIACDGNTVVALANGGVLQSAPLHPTSPSVITSPHDRTIVVGASVVMAVQALGTEPMSFHWFKDGEQLLGGTNRALVLRSVQLADSGSYYVVVSNSVSTITSNVASVRTLRIPHLTSVGISGEQIVMLFSKESGASYNVLFRPCGPPISTWQVLTNISPQFEGDAVVRDSRTNGSGRIYQLEVVMP
jgi:hypothetical protein